MLLLIICYLTDYHIDRFHLNLLPYMLLNVWLVGKIFIQLLMILELHDEGEPPSSYPAFLRRRRLLLQIVS